MPNWCNTTMVCTGEGAKNLLSIIESCEKKELHKSDFGNLWLGNIVIAMGLEWEKIFCRGSITSYEYDDSDETPELSIDYDSAWNPCYELMGAIRRMFNVELTYISEEPGCELFRTNDPGMEKCTLVEYENEETGEYLHEDLLPNEIRKFCRDVSDGICRTLEELDEWCRRQPDATLYYYAYEYFDDF